MIGFLPEARLTNIPPAYRDQHELCFYLHDAMVTLLKGAEDVQASVLNIRLESAGEADEFTRRNNPIEYFLDRGEIDIARRIALNQVTPALFADFLHFIYEALSCLERRKFVVAFALLRKPMQQNLLFASWMLADEAAFFEDLRRSPADHMEEHKFPADKRIRIFQCALSNVEHYGLLDASLINEIIYNKELPKGFAHLFAKANHLVTSRGQLARTENMNLNFIFKNPADNDVYESVYLSLSYLLWYALLIQIALFSRMRTVEDSFTRWMTITTMATFDSLFVEGSSHLAMGLIKALGKFMNCPHCKKRVSIGRKATGRLFLAQRVRCKTCKNEYDFPLFWLLSQVDWRVTGFESEKDRARIRELFREPVA
jgi:hypothetical protein